MGRQMGVAGPYGKRSAAMSVRSARSWAARKRPQATAVHPCQASRATDPPGSRSRAWSRKTAARKRGPTPLQNLIVCPVASATSSRPEKSDAGSWLERAHGRRMDRRQRQRIQALTGSNGPGLTGSQPFHGYAFDGQRHPICGGLRKDRGFRPSANLAGAGFWADEENADPPVPAAWLRRKAYMICTVVLVGTGPAPTNSGPRGRKRVAY